MHPILKSYLDQFVSGNGLDGLTEALQFERFVNYCCISRFSPDRIDLDSITTGDGEVGIDGAAILIGDELVTDATEAQARFESRSRDVSVRYVFVQSKSSEGFRRADMLNFGSAVRDLVSPAKELEQDPLLEEIAKIHQVIIRNAGKVRNGLPECSLYYATTGDWERSKSPDLMATMNQMKQDLEGLHLFNGVAFEPLGFDQLRTMWMATLSPVQATFRLEKELDIPTMEGVRQAYLTIVNAKHFVDTVLRDSEGRIRPTVFDQNVRHFLGEDNEVNAKIRNTLLDDRRKHRFAILNNGVTILSPDVRRVGSQITIKDYQIVNGCQTSHVLFQNYASLDDRVTLPVKVVEADEALVVDEVVEATNSQSQVPDSQMYAIKAHVRKLQEYFDAVGDKRGADQRLYFERRTQEFAGRNIPAIRILDIHQLAKSFAAMFLDQPHLAAGYSGQIFEENSDRIFAADQPEIAYYTAAFTHYRMFLLFNSGEHLDRSYSRFKWHLMMVLKYQLGGANQPPWTSARQMDQYCQRILDAISPSSRDAAPHVESAIQFLRPMVETSREQLKRKAFTDTLRDAVRQQMSSRRGPSGS